MHQFLFTHDAFVHVHTICSTTNARVDYILCWCAMCNAAQHAISLRALSFCFASLRFFVLLCFALHRRPPGRRLCNFAPEVAISPDPESAGPGQPSSSVRSSVPSVAFWAHNLLKFVLRPHTKWRRTMLAPT